MDQKIFTMELSVEATSLYLLMIALQGANTPLTRESCLQFWSSTPEGLETALSELSQRGVVRPGPQDDWQITPSDQWS